MAGIGVGALNQTREVGRLIGRITERVGGRVGLDRAVGLAALKVLKVDFTDDLQFSGTGVKGGDRDRISEDVVKPPDRKWLRTNHQASIQQAHVVTVAGTNHHTMISQSYRVRIFVDG